MKKVFLTVLSMLFIVSLAAGCAGEGNPASGPASEPSQGGTSSTPEEDTFEAPDNYASVLKVTINPVVNLYLDENHVVLAMEYVNADAKTTYGNIEQEIVGAKLDVGVKKLVDTANGAGLLAKEKKVTIDIVECAQQDKKEILSIAGGTVKQALQDNEVEADIDVKDNGTDVDQETFDEVTKTEEEKKAEQEADARNPNKSLKVGTRYVCAEKSEVEIAEYLFVTITFHENGDYGFSMGDYTSEDLYGEGDPFVYNGKNYYACTGLGGGGEYTLTDTEITLVQDEVVLVLNEKSELVIKSSDDTSVFVAGRVFAPLQ